MNTLIEAFTHARTLIAEKSRWTRGAVARDAAGQPCPLMGAEAVAYCAEGAIKRALGGATVYGPGGTYEALAEAFKVLESTPVFREVMEPDTASLAGFNDDRATRHEDVLTLFDQAIELAKTP